jgi:hypothetical protein
MQQQIRRSTFETNSSSSHSLTLDRNALVAQPFPKDVLRAGVVCVAPGDYGWEWERFYTPLNKLRYLVTHLLSFSDVSELNDCPQMEMLRKVVAEHTGCRIEVENNEGHIDHESLGRAGEVFADEATLHAFVFGRDSCVETGNDNSNPPWRIQTDRGTQELYHRTRVRDVPKDYVTVALSVGERRLITKNGAVLKNAMHANVVAELAAYGIVKSVRLTAGPNGFYAEQEPQSLAVSELRLLHDLGELAIARGFRASFKPSEKLERFELKTKLRVAMPPALAKTLEALPATPAVLLELREVEEQTDIWTKRTDVGEDAWRKQYLAELTEKRVELVEQARKAGIAVTSTKA